MTIDNSNKPGDVKQVLDVLSSAAKMLAPALPAWGMVAANGIAAALALVGDLIELGHDPVVVITEIRSALPDFEAAKARVHARIKAHEP